jgi:hypothetical protein
MDLGRSIDVSFVLCSLIALLVALAVPFITSDLRPAKRPSFSWGLAALAIVVLALSAFKLSRAALRQDEIFIALGVTTAMVAGVFTKWMMEVIADKPLALHEANLMRALLLAPLVVPIVGERVFAANLAPRTLVLWFANGFFWLTVVTDFVRLRTPERVIVRRVEPTAHPSAAISPSPPIRHA